MEGQALGRLTSISDLKIAFDTYDEKTKGEVVDRVLVAKVSFTAVEAQLDQCKDALITHAARRPVDVSFNTPDGESKVTNKSDLKISFDTMDEKAKGEVVDSVMVAKISFTVMGILPEQMQEALVAYAKRSAVDVYFSSPQYALQDEKTKAGKQMAMGEGN
jgi:hypothetical protein